MRIGLVSHFPARSPRATETAHECRSLLRYALALARHGLQNFWVCSTDTLALLTEYVTPLPGEATDVPATCRHVVPLRPYRLAGIRLFGVDRALWQHRDMHTRLFTLLELLQRELPCTALHAWGALPIAYVTAYTAGFLGLPVVVTYGRSSLCETPEAAFEWQWVARHLALALVHDQQERRRLLAVSQVPAARIRIMTPTLLSDRAAQEALYASLPCPAGTP